MKVRSPEASNLKLYFITHPEFEIDARVMAPSAKRAKTAYLDYLSRNGYIEWWSRSLHRRKLIVKRASGNEDADVVLHYMEGVTDEPEVSAPKTSHLTHMPKTSGYQFDGEQPEFWREETLL